MTVVAPSCPTSFGQPIPGQRTFLRGDPWSRPGVLKDMVNRIPRAHDLPSAINALNIMNNIMTMINRAEPQVNNIHPMGGGGVILKGENYEPDYWRNKQDWMQEGRDFKEQKLINPNNENQFIEIKTLKTVYFYNANTDYRLNYEGPFKQD